MILKNITLSFNNMYLFTEDIEVVGFTLYDADSRPTKNMNIPFNEVSDMVINGKIVRTGRPVRFSLLIGYWEIPAGGRVEHYVPLEMRETGT